MSKIYAADAIRATVRDTKALLEYADELEKIGSIEQAAQEARVATAKAREQLDLTNGMVVKAKGELEAVEAQIKAKAAEQEHLSKSILETAQNEAQSIRENATNRAVRIITEAESKAKTIEQEHVGNLNKIKEQSRATSSALKKTIDNKEKAEVELSAINGKLAEARSKISQFLAGN